MAYKKPKYKAEKKKFVGYGTCPHCGRVMNNLQKCSKCGTITCYKCCPTRCPVCDNPYSVGDSFSV